MKESELREQVILDAGVLSDPFWQGTRITRMLNLAQNWLQLKLIKQGFKNWLKESAALTVANTTLLGHNTSSVALPTDILYDMPIESAERSTATKPAKEIQLRNFDEIVVNGVFTPTVATSIFVIMDKVIHLYPRDVPNGTTSVKVTHTFRVTDLVKDAATESEIPIELQEILIDRVVMQIKSANGQEDIKQAKMAEIDKELSTKYQLDALKVEAIDKGVTQ